MTKKVNLLVLAVVVISLAVIVKVSSENGNASVTNGGAANGIASQICLDVIPPLEEIPTTSRYGVLTSALASRGISNFLNTDSAGGQRSFPILLNKLVRKICFDDNEGDDGEEDGGCPGSQGGRKQAAFPKSQSDSISYII